MFVQYTDFIDHEINAEWEKEQYNSWEQIYQQGTNNIEAQVVVQQTEFSSTLPSILFDIEYRMEII